MHYFSVVIILFNTGLCRSIFSTISFRTLLVLCLSLLSAFNKCYHHLKRSGYYVTLGGVTSETNGDSFFLNITVILGSS